MVLPPPSRRQMAKVDTDGMNTMVMPRDDAGHRQGEDHPAEYIGGVGAQVLCGLDDPVVDLVNDGVDGHDHEGQVVVYHAQRRPHPWC